MTYGPKPLFDVLTHFLIAIEVTFAELKLVAMFYYDELRPRVDEFVHVKKEKSIELYKDTCKSIQEYTTRL